MDTLDAGHGYDLMTVSSISTPVHRHFMVSGADEKEIRGFDAPLRTTRLLSAVAASRGVTADNCVEDIKRVDRAYIPALGLSNKASAADGADVDIGDGGDDADSVIRAQLKLPLERDLGAVSLWPETRKLYGHNTEIFCLTSTITAQTGPQYESNPFTKDVLVASSAKAREVTDAFIRIWNVEQAKCVSVLQGGHKSTVACLAFSPDGRYIVSSGKDRRLCLWKRKADNDFVLAFAKDSAHKRIVWSIHFCPHDPTLLASGSRDGPVKIWKIEEDDGTTSANVIFSFEASARTGPKAEAVTALSFAPRPWAEEDAMLAVGLESGMVELWRIPKEVSGSCALLGSISRQLSHIAAVTKLAWRPLVASASQGKVEGIMILASCSSDHGCRLFRIDHD
jgi:WD40 repeat protein